MARLGRVGPGMEHSQEDWKVLALGDEGAGKSSFVIQFVDSVLTYEYDPTIEDNFRKNIPVDGIVCTLDILDTASHENCSTAEGFLIFYSITSRSNFIEVDCYFEQVMREKDVDWVPWVFIGNKCDLVHQRKITTEEGMQLAKRFHAPFFETSAKDGTNVYEVVEALVRKMREHDPSVRRHKSRGGCILL